MAASDERPVAPDELVRGYEYEKWHYLVLTPEDFAAAVKRNSAIELLDFIPAGEVDDRSFDTRRPHGRRRHGTVRASLGQAAGPKAGAGRHRVAGTRNTPSGKGRTPAKPGGRRRAA